LTFAANRVSLG